VLPLLEPGDAIVEADVKQPASVSNAASTANAVVREMGNVPEMRPVTCSDTGSTLYTPLRTTKILPMLLSITGVLPSGPLHGNRADAFERVEVEYSYTIGRAYVQARAHRCQSPGPPPDW